MLLPTFVGDVVSGVLFLRLPVLFGTAPVWVVCSSVNPGGVNAPSPLSTHSLLPSSSVQVVEKERGVKAARLHLLYPAAFD